MSTAIDILERKIEDLTEALVGMVAQHCYSDSEGGLNTGALWANADAVELLEKLGRVEITRGCGRMTVFRWKKQP